MPNTTSTKKVQFDLDRKHFSIARANPFKANVYDLRQIGDASKARLSAVLNGYNAKVFVNFFDDMTPEITVKYSYFWVDEVAVTPVVDVPIDPILTTEEADQIVHDRNFTSKVDDYEFVVQTGKHYYFLDDGRTLIIAPHGVLMLVDPEPDDDPTPTLGGAQDDESDAWYDEPSDFPEHDFFESDDIGGDDFDDPYEMGDMEMSERRMLREDARLDALNDAKEAEQQAVAPRQPYAKHTTHARRAELDELYLKLGYAGQKTGETAVEMIEAKATWLRVMGAFDYADAVALVARTLAEQQATKPESEMTTRRARLAELLAANYDWSPAVAQSRVSGLAPEVVETWYNDLRRHCVGAPYDDPEDYQ